MNLFSKRWILLILRALNGGTLLFNALQRELGGISSRTLSERLRDLEAAGFVARTIVSERPIKIEYRPTAKARSFETHLAAIGAWACEWDGCK